MPKCIELLPCDWLIRNLCYQAIEQVYLIKWPVSIYIYFFFSKYIFFSFLCVCVCVCVCLFTRIGQNRQEVKWERERGVGSGKVGLELGTPEAQWRYVSYICRYMYIIHHIFNVRTNTAIYNLNVRGFIIHYRLAWQTKCGTNILITHTKRCFSLKSVKKWCITPV